MELAISTAAEAGPDVSYQNLRALVDMHLSALEAQPVGKAGKRLRDEVDKISGRSLGILNQGAKRARPVLNNTHSSATDRKGWTDILIPYITQDLSGLAQTRDALGQERDGLIRRGAENMLEY